MTKDLKNAKINALAELQIKYNRFSKALNTEGINRAAVQAILEAISEQKAMLEAELAVLS